jgi:hypothetical protein
MNIFLHNMQICRNNIALDKLKGKINFFFFYWFFITPELVTISPYGSN